MNSHVQMPKSILQSFSNKETIRNEDKTVKSNMIYCLKMDGTISYLDIKNCNTIEDYYYPGIEQLLSDKESRFGEIKKKIVNYCEKRNRELSITVEDINTIKEFYKLYLYRSMHTVENIKKDSLAYQIFKVSVENVTIAIGLDDSVKLESMIDSYVDAQILINESNKNFVIPQQGFYHLQHENMNWLVMPLTTKTAIALVDKYDEKNNAIRTLDDIDVNCFNKFAIKGEFTNNKQAVYAKELKDFDDYKEIINKLKQNEI